MANGHEPEDRDPMGTFRALPATTRALFLVALVVAYFVVDSAFNQVFAAVDSLVSPVVGGIYSTDIEVKWTSNEPNAEAWWLYIGSTVGAHDIYDSAGDGGEIATTSRVVGGLPSDGSALYFRVWERVGATWLTYDFGSFSAWDGVSTVPANAGIGGVVELSVTDRESVADLNSKLDWLITIGVVGGAFAALVGGYSVGTRFV